jgi:hypothetical protein
MYNRPNHWSSWFGSTFNTLCWDLIPLVPEGCVNASSLAPVLISPLALWMNWLQPRKSPKLVSSSQARSAEALISISPCNCFLNIIKNFQLHHLLIEHNNIHGTSQSRRSIALRIKTSIVGWDS